METIFSNPVEQNIYYYSRWKDRTGHISNTDWRWIHCPLNGREVYAYNNRFRNLFPEDSGVNGIDQWVEMFRWRNNREPVVLEFMGPRTLLDTLGVPGVYVNWEGGLPDGLTVEDGEGGRIVGISSDIENLPFFLPLFDEALEYYNEADMVVWKAEGGLVFLDPSPSSFCYWFDKLTSILSPGGIALIQGVSNLHSDTGTKSISPDIFVKRVQVNRNGRITYREFPGSHPFDNSFCMFVENQNGGPMGVFY